jgi:adenylate kinase family enzyme
MKDKNNKIIKRIAIIGSPGSGKTTLSENLGRVYKLPVVHLDSIHYLDNWVLRETKERDKMIVEEANKNEWILDGTFIDTLDHRLDRADLVIFLDFSRFTDMKGIFLRKFPLLKRKRKIPNLTLSFIWYVFTYNNTQRKFIMEKLKKCNQNKILTFQKQKDLEKWLRKLYVDNALDVELIEK